MLTRRDQTDLLPAIACPTLLACGRQDSYSPLDRHEDMHARIPGSTLAIIEGAGHMAPMEEPEQVTQAMARWLGL
jgi:pimeloyl-ACP methyl ester carboxylesterase